MAFIFCNGIFHGGVFAWLGLLIASRYHLEDIGIGIVLAGYGLPDLLFGGIIGGWGDRYGRRYVVPLGFLWAGICAFLLAFPISRFLAALIVTALSIGFEATHPLMSTIATSLDPRHRGQITGLATFIKFLGMGVGALIFRHLIGLSFRTALMVFATIEILVGLAAIYGFRKEDNRVTKILVERINSDRNLLINTTSNDEKIYSRIAIMSASTTAAIAKELLTKIRMSLSKLLE
jgi:MFS family permease